jgi:hypothetical protein
MLRALLARIPPEQCDAISDGTKAAAAKARGVRLGNPNGAAALRRAAAAGKGGAQALKVQADARAKLVEAETAVCAQRSITTPWSVLKISGLPKRVSASCRASAQKSVFSVLQVRHAITITLRLWRQGSDGCRFGRTYRPRAARFGMARTGFG